MPSKVEQFVNSRSKIQIDSSAIPIVAKPLPLCYCCIVLRLKDVFCKAKNHNDNFTIILLIVHHSSFIKNVSRTT